MCGIAGIISPLADASVEAVRPMIDAQRHRGPDDSGLWADGVCALGHRRLSIVDLSAAGRQPMAGAGGALQITFNGEIYNYLDLRRELESRGCVFRTRTDTEVVLQAYEQWGTDCLHRFRGMFAFGIWDARARRLFLARDRVGKKPLHYALDGDRLLFSSEIQGMLAGTGISREVLPEAIDLYLSYGYIPAPQTAYRAIHKLPPAHYLIAEVANGGIRLTIERYWELRYLPKREMTEADACEGIREKLTEAVRLRMISDVPLGAFLSGGIDSSIVVGLMAGLSRERVRTFSIGFREAEYNELAHARRIAERWNTDHQEFVLEADALAILPQLVRHYGEPYADSSAIPTYYVAQATRRHVTVALNGDGGDESFAGYERYLANQLAERLQAIPGVGAAARGLSRLLPDSIHPKSRLRQAKRFLTVSTMPMRQRYPRWLTFFHAEGKAALYTREFAEAVGLGREEWLSGLLAGTPAMAPADMAMCVDVNSYLPYDLLVKVDIATMAHGLEGRSPFLDHEVMEFAARLPAAMKLRRGRLKHLLKRAFPDLLPPENVNRRKMGFGVPVGQWFRGPLRELLRDALLSEATARRGYFQAREVARLVNEHLESRADHSFQLWNLLFLELWQQDSENLSHE
ncbi:MAG: asparagine synthase (glutamine-hydrolyzing) [Blastocatellia bacterium]|nr:asparagine synthase (glutamine-hydrolyzing) [Blastocatellia bacterium]